MRCPFCGNMDTQVKDSRPSDDGRTIRRRRECPHCNRRFTTFESFQLQQVVVVKRDGKKVMFEREKLLNSLITALRKRKLVLANDLVSDLEQQLAELNRNEITSQELGEMVMKRLKDIDFVAYVRYASVYHDFHNASDFKALLDTAE